MCVVHKFTTGGIAPKDRLRAWGEQVWSAVGGLETRTFGAEVFEAEAQTGRLGPIALCRIVVGRHKVERTEALIRRSDPDLLKIVFPIRGSSYFRQNGAEVILQPGQWCAYDTSQPYVSATCETAELLTVLVPRSLLNTKAFDVARCLVKPYTVDGGVSQVLFRSLSTAMQELEAMDAAAAESLGAYLIDLVRLCLVEKSRSEPRARVTSRDTMRERIERHIDRNLGDPDLSIDSIAKALGCTKRYLHKVFTEKGQTLSHHIWNLRLERCAADLARPELARKAITEVAFDWGFNNSAHFSRSFKERFGMPPRTYRAVHGALLAPPAAAA